MAKISAYGAREVARMKGRRPGTDYDATFVITSDGRVLRKIAAQSGYTVLGKVKPEHQNRDGLARVLAHFGYREV